MPTSTELERITALVNRLLPLSTKRRGELIEAEDWNAVVSALLEVARATLAAGEHASVPDHAHPDQVGVGWLDPRLRELVNSGSPITGTTVGLLNLRRDLGGLQARLDATDTTVAGVVSKVDQSTSRLLQREADLDRLDRTVLGAAESRADVADLRLDLDRIRGQVDVAVKVSSQLQVGGEPLDVNGLVRKVARLEKLRQALTRADGALLDATEFDRQVAELRASLVTQETLTESLAQLRREVVEGEVFDRGQLLAEATAAATQASTSSVEALGSQLRAELGEGLGGIEPALAREVERATVGLADTILADAERTLRARFDERAQELQAGVDATLDHRLGQLQETVGAELSSVRERLAGQLTELLRSELDQQLAPALGQLSARLDEVARSVTELDRRTTRTEEADRTAATQLAQAVREQEAARSALRDQLTGRLDEVAGGLPGLVTSAVDQARAATRSELTSMVEAMRRDLTASLAEVARKQAVTEVQVLSTSIRSDLHGVIRQEVDASLRRVRDQLQDEVTAMQSRVGGLVVEEVTRATAAIPDRVRAELDAFKPELTRSIDATVARQIRALNRPPDR